MSRPSSIHNIIITASDEQYDKTVKINRNNKDERCIINLSNHVLSDNERSTLLKGLKFCRTWLTWNTVRLQIFQRRMRLRSFSHNPDVDNINSQTGTTPSQTTLDNFLNIPSTYAQSNSSITQNDPHRKFNACELNLIQWDPMLETSALEYLEPKISHEGQAQKGYGTLRVNIFPYPEKQHGINFISYDYCWHQQLFIRNVEIGILSYSNAVKVIQLCEVCMHGRFEYFMFLFWGMGLFNIVKVKWHKT